MCSGGKKDDDDNNNAPIERPERILQAPIIEAARKEKADREEKVNKDRMKYRGGEKGTKRKKLVGTPIGVATAYSMGEDYLGGDMPSLASQGDLTGMYLG